MNNNNNNNNNSNEILEYDICIIGGGLAGLSSINNLLEYNKNNLSILLIESRNKIGGRTNTILIEHLQQQLEQQQQQQQQVGEEEENNKNKKKCLADIGGQWIGTDHYKALSLISKYSLELEEQIYPHYNNDNNDSHLLDSLVSMVSYQFPDLTNEEEEQINYFVQLIDELGTKLSLDNPWNIENANEMDISIYDYVLKIISLPRAQQEIFIFIQTILATSPHDCSFLFFLYYIASGGGMRALGDGIHGAQRWKVIGGAQKISEKLLEDILIRTNNNQHKFNYYLSTPVKSITYNKENNESNKLIICAKHDSKEILFKCKRVILAMSPRLSNSTIQFIPPLPEPKQALSNVMVPGSCVKVLIPYHNEFWLSGINNQPIKGTKSLEEIYPMHNMFHTTVGPYPALVGLITGDHAKSYIKLSEEEKRQAILHQIHDLFCSYKLEYSSNIENSPAWNPIDIIEKSWVNEEYSGGCFACLFRPNYFCSYGKYLKSPLGYPQLNSNNNDDDNYWITPLIDENLLYETAIEWASTETAPMFSGYMEGAILAGEEAAKRILSSL